MLEPLRIVPALALLLLAPLGAGQQGKQQSFRSPSARWQLVVTYGSGTRASEPQPATAVWIGPEGESPAFELPFPRAPYEALVAEDGSALLFDDRDHHGVGVVLAALEPDGSLRWQRTLEELLPAEEIERLAGGVQSRQWRARPVELEWQLEADVRTGFTLRLWSQDLLHVSLADGGARYEDVLDHGTDARAWMTSARSLLSARLYEQAIPELRRVVELDPKNLVAWHELGRALEQVGRVDEGLEAMRRGALENPISKTPKLPGYEQTARNIWLHTRLAQAYQRAGRSEFAERTALACLEIDAGLWDAAELYAGALWARGEFDLAQKFLKKTWRYLAAPPSESARKRTLTQAAFRLGEFYYQRQRFADARDYFQRGFEGGDYHDLLCTHLAQSYEELGEYGLAIEVVAVQLERFLQRSAELDDPTARQITEERIRRLEREVTRLDALDRGDG